MTGRLLWQWIGRRLLGCGDSEYLGVRAAFGFGVTRFLVLRISVAVWE